MASPSGAGSARISIGDDELWIGRDPPSNRNSLALAAGQFVRVAAQEAAGQLDPVDERSHRILNLAARC
jgi:hypothetical protein